MADRPNTYINIGGDLLDATQFVPPADRSYRAAWERSGPQIVVDMPAARDLHRDALRRERAALLANADVEFMRRLELGQDTSEVVAHKQALRDVPQNPLIELAQTPEELKALTIAVLTS